MEPAIKTEGDVMAFSPGNFNWAALAALGSGNTVGEQFASANHTIASQQPLIAQQQQMNKTLAYLKQANPTLAAQVEAGMPVSEAWQQVVQAQQPKKSSFQVLPDGTYGAWDGQQFNKLGTAQKPANLPAFADEYNWMVTQGFKGTPEDYQKHKASLDDGKTSDRFKTELETMKSYRGEDPVKTFQATRDAYEKVRTSAQLSTAQGDMGLIYGFMKMLDPTSVVREGEYATAENSGGIPDTVANWYNRAKDGQRLTPQQRQEFVAAAEAQYRNTEKNLQEVNARYKGLADQYEVPTERFLEVPKAYPPLTIGQKIQTKVGGKDATIEKISD
jgi:hypothetical protein